MKITPSRPTLSRLFRLGLTAVFFAGQVLLPHAVEAGFWKERQEKTTPSHLNAGGQLASLSGFPASALPSFSPLDSSSLTSPFPKGLPSDDRDDSVFAALLSSVHHRYGISRKILRPKGASKGVVLHLQDIHDHVEAQNNLASLIQNAVNTKTVSVVGLEGADAEINWEALDQFEDRESLLEAARHLVSTKQLPGSLLARTALGSQGPAFIGVEKEKLYQENIDSFLSAEKSSALVRSSLEEASRRLQEKKDIVLTARLKEFDSLLEKQKTGELSLGEFVSHLFRLARAAGLPDEKGVLSDFYQAVSLEKSLKLARVDRERKEFLEQLLASLDPADVARLTAWARLQKRGEISQVDFYWRLGSLAKERGVLLEEYAAFSEYVSYVSLAESINGEDLFHSLMRYEEKVLAALKPLPSEKHLFDLHSTAGLLEKLVRFELTPMEYRMLRENNIPQLLKDLERETGTAMFLPEGFQGFYEAALSRNEFLAGNLISKMKPGQAAVLVTGGFHGNGIGEMLTREGFTVIQAVPHIGKINEGEGAAYLTAFAQARTPLEKWAQKEKVFLTQPVGTPAQKARLTLLGAARSLYLHFGGASRPALRERFLSLTGVNARAVRMENNRVEIDLDDETAFNAAFSKDGKILSSEEPVRRPGLWETAFTAVREFPRTLTAALSPRREKENQFVLDHDSTLADLPAAYVRLAGLTHLRRASFIGLAAGLGAALLSHSGPSGFLALSLAGLSAFHLSSHILHNQLWPEAALSLPKKAEGKTWVPLDELSFRLASVGNLERSVEPKEGGISAEDFEKNYEAYLDDLAVFWKDTHQFKGVERIDTAIKQQTSSQYGGLHEAVANSIDSVLVSLNFPSIGRFGNGFRAVLKTLYDFPSPQTRVVLTTKTKTGPARRIEFRLGDAGRGAAKKKRVEVSWSRLDDEVPTGTSLDVIIPRPFKGKRKEFLSGLEASLREHFGANHYLPIYFTNKKGETVWINGDQSVVDPSGEKVNGHGSRPGVTVFEKESGFAVVDPGTGISDKKLLEGFFIAQIRDQAKAESVQRVDARKGITAAPSEYLVALKPRAGEIQEKRPAVIRVLRMGRTIFTLKSKADKPWEGRNIPEEFLLELPAGARVGGAWTSYDLNIDKERPERDEVKIFIDHILGAAGWSLEERVQALNAFALILKEYDLNRGSGRVDRARELLAPFFQEMKEQKRAVLPAEAGYFNIETGNGGPVFLDEAYLPGFYPVGVPGIDPVKKFGEPGNEYKREETASLFIVDFKSGETKVFKDYTRNLFFLDRQTLKDHQENPAPPANLLKANNSYTAGQGELILPDPGVSEAEPDHSAAYRKEFPFIHYLSDAVRLQLFDFLSGVDPTLARKWLARAAEVAALVIEGPSHFMDQAISVILSRGGRDVSSAPEVAALDLSLGALPANTLIIEEGEVYEQFLNKLIWRKDGGEVEINPASSPLEDVFTAHGRLFGIRYSGAAFFEEFDKATEAWINVGWVSFTKGSWGMEVGDNEVWVFSPGERRVNVFKTTSESSKVESAEVFMPMEKVKFNGVVEAGDGEAFVWGKNDEGQIYFISKKVLVESLPDDEEAELEKKLIYLPENLAPDFEFKGFDFIVPFANSLIFGVYGSSPILDHDHRRFALKDERFYAWSGGGALDAGSLEDAALFDGNLIFKEGALHEPLRKATSVNVVDQEGSGLGEFSFSSLPLSMKGGAYAAGGRLYPQEDGIYFPGYVNGEEENWRLMRYGYPTPKPVREESLEVLFMGDEVESSYPIVAGKEVIMISREGILPRDSRIESLAEDFRGGVSHGRDWGVLGRLKGMDRQAALLVSFDKKHLDTPDVVPLSEELDGYPAYATNLGFFDGQWIYTLVAEKGKKREVRNLNEEVILTLPPDYDAPKSVGDFLVGSLRSGSGGQLWIYHPKRKMKSYSVPEVTSLYPESAVPYRDGFLIQGIKESSHLDKGFLYFVNWQGVLKVEVPGNPDNITPVGFIGDDFYFADLYGLQKGRFQVEGEGTHLHLRLNWKDIPLLKGWPLSEMAIGPDFVVASISQDGDFETQVVKYTPGNEEEEEFEPAPEESVPVEVVFKKIDKRLVAAEFLAVEDSLVFVSGDWVIFNTGEDLLEERIPSFDHAKSPIIFNGVYYFLAQDPEHNQWFVFEYSPSERREPGFRIRMSNFGALPREHKGIPLSPDKLVNFKGRLTAVLREEKSDGEILLFDLEIGKNSEKTYAVREFHALENLLLMGGSMQESSYYLTLLEVENSNKEVSQKSFIFEEVREIQRNPIPHKDGVLAVLSDFSLADSLVFLSPSGFKKIEFTGPSTPDRGMGTADLLVINVDGDLLISGSDGGLYLGELSGLEGPEGENAQMKLTPISVPLEAESTPGDWYVETFFESDGFGYQTRINDKTDEITILKINPRAVKKASRPSETSTVKGTWAPFIREKGFREVGGIIQVGDEIYYTQWGEFPQRRVVHRLTRNGKGHTYLPVGAFDLNPRLMRFQDQAVEFRMSEDGLGKFNAVDDLNLSIDEPFKTGELGIVDASDLEFTADGRDIFYSYSFRIFRHGVGVVHEEIGKSTLLSEDRGGPADRVGFIKETGDAEAVFMRWVPGLQQFEQSAPFHSWRWDDIGRFAHHVFPYVSGFLAAVEGHLSTDNPNMIFITHDIAVPVTLPADWTQVYDFSIVGPHLYGRALTKDGVQRLFRARLPFFIPPDSVSLEVEYLDRELNLHDGFRQIYALDDGIVVKTRHGEWEKFTPEEKNKPEEKQEPLDPRWEILAEDPELETASAFAQVGDDIYVMTHDYEDEITTIYELEKDGLYGAKRYKSGEVGDQILDHEGKLHFLTSKADRTYISYSGPEEVETRLDVSHAGALEPGDLSLASGGKDGLFYLYDDTIWSRWTGMTRKYDSIYLDTLLSHEGGVYFLLNVGDFQAAIMSWSSSNTEFEPLGAVFSWKKDLEKNVTAIRPLSEGFLVFEPGRPLGEGNQPMWVTKNGSGEIFLPKVFSVVWDVAAIGQDVFILGDTAEGKRALFHGAPQPHISGPADFLEYEVFPLPGDNQKYRNLFSGDKTEEVSPGKDHSPGLSRLFVLGDSVVVQTVPGRWEKFTPGKSAEEEDAPENDVLDSWGTEDLGLKVDNLVDALEVQGHLFVIEKRKADGQLALYHKSPGGDWMGIGDPWPVSKEAEGKESDHYRMATDGENVFFTMFQRKRGKYAVRTLNVKNPLDVIQIYESVEQPHSLVYEIDYKIFLFGSKGKNFKIYWDDEEKRWVALDETGWSSLINLGLIQNGENSWVAWRPVDVGRNKVSLGPESNEDLEFEFTLPWNVDFVNWNMISVPGGYLVAVTDQPEPRYFFLNEKNSKAVAIPFEVSPPAEVRRHLSFLELNGEVFEAVGIEGGGWILRKLIVKKVGDAVNDWRLAYEMVPARAILDLKGNAVPVSDGFITLSNDNTLTRFAPRKPESKEKERVFAPENIVFEDSDVEKSSLVRLGEKMFSLEVRRQPSLEFYEYRLFEITDGEKQLLKKMNLDFSWVSDLFIHKGHLAWVLEQETDSVVSKKSLMMVTLSEEGDFRTNRPFFYESLTSIRQTEEGIWGVLHEGPESRRYVFASYENLAGTVGDWDISIRLDETLTPLSKSHPFGGEEAFFIGEDEQGETRLGYYFPALPDASPRPYHFKGGDEWIMDWPNLGVLGDSLYFFGWNKTENKKGLVSLNFSGGVNFVYPDVWKEYKLEEFMGDPQVPFVKLNGNLYVPAGMREGILGIMEISPDGVRVLDLHIPYEGFVCIFGDSLRTDGENLLFKVGTLKGDGQFWVKVDPRGVVLAEEESSINLGGTFPLSEYREAASEFILKNLPFLRSNAQKRKDLFVRLFYENDIPVEKKEAFLKLFTLLPEPYLKYLRNGLLDVLLPFADSRPGLASLQDFFSIAEARASQISSVKEAVDFFKNWMRLFEFLESDPDQWDDFFHQMDNGGLNLLSQKKKISPEDTETAQQYFYLLFLRGEGGRILGSEPKESIERGEIPLTGALSSNLIEMEGRTSVSSGRSGLHIGRFKIAYDAEQKNAKERARDKNPSRFMDAGSMEEVEALLLRHQGKRIDNVEGRVKSTIDSQSVSPGRELVQNSRDALREETNERPLPPIQIDIFIRPEKKEVVRRFHDDAGMARSVILGPLLVPNISSKALNKLLAGLFGQGFFTLFDNFDRVQIKTGKNGEVFYLTFEKDAEGNPLLVSFEETAEPFKGTLIDWVSFYDKDPPFIEALFFGLDLVRQVGAIPSSEVEIVLNGIPLNENMDVVEEVPVLFEEDGVKKEGVVTLSLSSESRLKRRTQDFLAYPALKGWELALLPEKYDELLTGRGFNINDNFIPLTQDRSSEAGVENYKKPVQQALFAAAIRAAVQIYFQRGTLPPGFDTTYFSFSISPAALFRNRALFPEVVEAADLLNSDNPAALDAFPTHLFTPKPGDSVDELRKKSSRTDVLVTLVAVRLPNGETTTLEIERIKQIERVEEAMRKKEAQDLEKAKEDYVSRGMGQGFASFMAVEGLNLESRLTTLNTPSLSISSGEMDNDPFLRSIKLFWTEIKEAFDDPRFDDILLTFFYQPSPVLGQFNEEEGRIGVNLYAFFRQFKEFKEFLQNEGVGHENFWFFMDKQDTIGHELAHSGDLGHSEGLLEEDEKARFSSLLVDREDRNELLAHTFESFLEENYALYLESGREANAPSIASYVKMESPDAMNQAKQAIQRIKDKYEDETGQPSDPFPSSIFFVFSGEVVLGVAGLLALEIPALVFLSWSLPWILGPGLGVVVFSLLMAGFARLHQSSPFRFSFDRPSTLKEWTGHAAVFSLYVLASPFAAHWPAVLLIPVLNHLLVDAKRFKSLSPDRHAEPLLNNLEQDLLPPLENLGVEFAGGPVFLSRLSDRRWNGFKTALSEGLRQHVLSPAQSTQENLQRRLLPLAVEGKGKDAPAYLDENDLGLAYAPSQRDVILRLASQLKDKTNRLLLFGTKDDEFSAELEALLPGRVRWEEGDLVDEREGQLILRLLELENAVSRLSLEDRTRLTLTLPSDLLFDESGLRDGGSVLDSVTILVLDDALRAFPVYFQGLKNIGRMTRLIGSQA